MDIENYNYIDLVFREYHDGLLTEEVRRKQNEKLLQSEDEINKEKLHAAEVLLLMEKAPPGMEFKRDNIDFVNNFFISLVALSFTNILEEQQA